MESCVRQAVIVQYIHDQRPNRETMFMVETTISDMWAMPHRTYCLSLSRGGYPQREPVAVDRYVVT